MTVSILVIDDTTQIREALVGVLSGLDVKLRKVDDFASAKRKLIQSAPDLIVSALTIGQDTAGGYQFCKDLQGHSELCKIPVLLIGENQPSADEVKEAQNFGAKDLLPWPISRSSLRDTIRPLLSQLDWGVEIEDEISVEAPKPPPAAKPAAAAGSAPLAKAARPANVVVTGGPPGMESEFDEETQKLKFAQRLLAQVLHNLKSSNLLGVAELEDVPRILCGITRTVCGVSEEEMERDLIAEAQARAQARAKAKEEPAESSLDLDSVFGLKK